MAQVGFLIEYCMCTKADVSLNAGIGGGLGSLPIAVLHNTILPQVYRYAVKAPTLGQSGHKNVSF